MSRWRKLLQNSLAGSESQYHGYFLDGGRRASVSAMDWLLGFLHNYAPVNFPMKILMTAAAAVLLSGAVNGAADVKVMDYILSVK